MSFVFRPATRENTPLIIGLAGPTKSGKTMSALRLGVGLSNNGKVAMGNAEGKRGEQYAEWFEREYKQRYLNCNIEAPYSPERYTELLLAMAKERPDVGILDSASHMHDGPGGLLEYHDAELDRIAGKTDFAKRDRSNFTAWIKPKAAENKFIYTMLSLDFPVILCFRAKEKLKIVPGKQPIDLGWQPIAGERITFETIFTLVLPPHSKGVPDLALSEMRMPFDEMVPKGKPIDEELGRKLAEWAKGGAPGSPAAIARATVAAQVSALSAGADGGKTSGPTVKAETTTPQGAEEFLNQDDVRDLETHAEAVGIRFSAVIDQLMKQGFKTLESVPREHKSTIDRWIEGRRKATA